MLCPKCGWNNPDDAQTCVNCQAELARVEQPQQQAAQQPGQTVQQPSGYYSVPDYMTWSIIITALCGLVAMSCCIPFGPEVAAVFGVLAIVKSTRANMRRDIGDYAGAMWEASAAKTWLNWAGGVLAGTVVLGIIGMILYFGFYITFMASLLRSMPHH